MPVHDETVNFLVQDPAWSDLRAAVIQCRIGACTAPLFTGKDWRVIQVLDRVQGPLQWEQLPQQAQQQVAQGVGGQLKQQRVAAYQDSLWKAINPTLMPDNLRQLPWPVPGTFDVGM